MKEPDGLYNLLHKTIKRDEAEREYWRKHVEIIARNELVQAFVRASIDCRAEAARCSSTHWKTFYSERALAYNNIANAIAKGAQIAIND